MGNGPWEELTRRVTQLENEAKTREGLLRSMAGALCELQQVAQLLRRKDSSLNQDVHRLERGLEDLRKKVLRSR